MSLAKVRESLSPSAYRAVSYILTESSDADATVNLLARLFDGLTSKQVAEIAANLHQLHYACLVFAHSAWLGETVVREPDCLLQPAEGTEFERCWSREDFRNEFARFRDRSDDKDLSRMLARFRRRQYVRILLRDLLEIARVGEVTEEISGLSDALLEESVLAVEAELKRQQGIHEEVERQGSRRKARFAVLSLGKLGGNELNYCSDVDLLFLYDAEDDGRAAEAKSRAYFTELAQRTTELLSRPTQEGRVFRIDLRLRPQGPDGEPAVALRKALKYYSETAEDWELQAMIKARHSAGNESLSREFIRAVAPLVYRPNLNFAAVKTALQARERLDRRGRSRPRIEASGRAINVKLDRGGIRDIEFLVQCLQRVYGGKELWLQSRGTLPALQKLHDKEHISGADFHTLGKTYEFLRVIEHRLQLRLGLQTHKLPTAADELRVLAKSVDRRETTTESEEDFTGRVRRQMMAATEIYRRIIYREQSNEGKHPDTVSNAAGTRSLSPSDQSIGKTQIARVIPELWAEIRPRNVPPHMRRKLQQFLHSAGSGSERLARTPRNAESILRTLPVFEFSDYLSEIMIRHPEDLEVLANPGESSAPKDSEATADRWKGAISLRTRFRRAMLSANAQGLGDSFHVWELLACNSEIAQLAVARALELCAPPPGLAVLALGRLGSREFDVLSDADLVFVADERADINECCRAAAELVEVLAAYTREGRVFPVDVRLRPRGSEGELVSKPSGLATYFSQEGSAWEAITYPRLRLVAGNRSVAEQAIRAVRWGIKTMAERPDFGADLRDMRGRLESSDSSPNLKTGAGGTYDIDFLTGNLQCRNSLWCNGNLAERIDLLHRHRLLADEDAQRLSRNAAFLRRFEHCVRIVTGHSYKWLPPGDVARAIVGRWMSASLPDERNEGLEVKLRAVMQQNRQILSRYPF